MDKILYNFIAGSIKTKVFFFLQFLFITMLTLLHGNIKLQCNKNL